LQATGGAGILLIEEDNFRHAEVFIGLERPVKIFKQLFKFGGYFVLADSNHSTISTGFKFGIDFFNSFTNKWSY